MSMGHRIYIEIAVLGIRNPITDQVVRARTLLTVNYTDSIRAIRGWVSYFGSRQEPVLPPSSFPFLMRQ